MLGDRVRLPVIHGEADVIIRQLKAQGDTDSGCFYNLSRGRSRILT